MNTTHLKRRQGLWFFVGFLLCVPLANWMVLAVGTVCVPHGPCLIPVAPGIMAPSGVMLVGLALVLRDLVQRRLGKAWVVAAIFSGAVMSLVLSPKELVLASAAAFLLSELADFAVYTPLQQKGLIKAVLFSSVVGLVVDSMVFLYLAFGSLEFLSGQVIGKVWMVLLSLPLIWWLREYDTRHQLQPVG